MKIIVTFEPSPEWMVKQETNPEKLKRDLQLMATQASEEGIVVTTEVIL